MISGRLGGGKSTLLTALGRRGYITVGEPDRRLVKEEMLGNGLALPLVDETAFARHAITLSLTLLDQRAGRGIYPRVVTREPQGPPIGHFH